MKTKIGDYQTIDTLGKSQIGLVIKVYEGAIVNLKTAMQYYRENERSQGYKTLERAKKFLVHLYTTLDEGKGGEIAANLARLYAYIIEQINFVQATGEIAHLDDIIMILNNVKEGWVELAQPGRDSRLRPKQHRSDHPPVQNIKLTV
jgi:flagellar protein FliS